MKVRCRGCKTYIDKHIAIRLGLSHYCGYQCVKYPERKPAKPSTTDHYNQVMEDDNWSCRGCGKRSVQIHHIIYRSQQGTDDYTNLISLCQACHAKVHQATREEYEPLLFELVRLRQQGDRVTRVVDLKRRQ